MSLQLNTYLGYRAYFENIAQQHVEIQGFRYGDDKVIKTFNRSGLAKVFLHCLPYESARYTGPNIDQQYRRKRARFAILKTRVSDKFEDENADFIFCESIALDIAARMIYRDKPNLNVILDINSLEHKPVEDTLGATKYYGIQTEVDVMDNPRMFLDVTKWNDL